MAKQTFTAGQVLTAAQMNNLQTDIFNQTTSTKTGNYSLVVGDRGTRLIGNGTSITFTVDNNIFTAGDTIKIHNINSTVLTIAAGAGVTINAAAGLTMSQYQEATLFATSASSFILFESSASSAQGLTLLNTTSFSGVASQSVNNVFTTTYDNYYIVCDISSFSGTDVDLRFRLRASGVDYTTGNHYIGNAAGTFPSTFGFSSTTTATSGVLGYGGASTSNTFFATLASPQLARNKQMVVTTFRQFAAFGYNSTTSTFPTSSSYDGFTIFPTAGNISGSVSAYGFNK